MIILWVFLAAVFLIIELFTVGMVSIWFFIGALVSLLSAAIGAPVWLQVALFIIISAGSFLLLYPRLKHMVKKSGEPTNADMIIGKNCYVVRKIDNTDGSGAVNIDGKTWTARSADDTTIEEGTLVCIREIQGVKVIVTPVSGNN